LIQIKKHLLHYYKALWTNNSLQENYWNKDNVDDGLIITEELKEALKNGKSYGEDNLNYEL
jgi:hypothetical protein